MIEAYAFLAAFAVQVLVVSAVNTTRLVKYVRNWSANYGSERFAQVYPGVDLERWVGRFVTGYRAANAVIVLVGLVLLGWLFKVVQQPGWPAATTNLPTFYLMLQCSPLILLALYSLRYRKLFQEAQGTRRTASLQRRGLSDFVSPLTQAVAALSFVLFFPFAIWVDLYVYGNASLSIYCYTAMASVVFVYALNAFIIYKMLYGRKNPFLTHEGRLHTIRMSVKSCVYSCIAVVWFIVASSFVTKLELESWRPFAVTVFVVLVMLMSLKDLTVPMGGTQGDASPGLST